MAIGGVGSGEFVQPIEILLVEDNAGDVLLTKEALRSAKIQTNLSVVGDGVDALAFLRRGGLYVNAERPDLILLDLNLPRIDGREVLAAILGDQALCAISVVILTVSRREQDLLRSFEPQVCGYATKPIDLEQFVAIVHAIKSFWFTIVTFPKVDAPDSSLLSPE